MSGRGPESSHHARKDRGQVRNQSGRSRRLSGVAYELRGLDDFLGVDERMAGPIGTERARLQLLGNCVVWALTLNRQGTVGVGPG